jgi:4-hydroxybenzoate polyprenyltransferase
MLVRPLDGASAAAMVSLGAILAHETDGLRVAGAAVGTFAATAFAMAVNDYFDQLGDRVNQSRRPLVVGALDECTARRVAFAAAAVGISAAALVGWLGIAVISSYLLLGWLYSRCLKPAAPLSAPAIVGLLAGSTVVFGGLLGSNPTSTFLAATIASVFIFGRELLKAARDEAGDLAQGCRTVAIKYGVQRAVHWYVAVSLLAGVLAVGPLLRGAAASYAFFAIPNIAYLLCLGLYVRQRPTVERASRVVDLSKISWLFWITAAIAFQ